MITSFGEEEDIKELRATYDLRYQEGGFATLAGHQIAAILRHAGIVLRSTGPKVRLRSWRSISRRSSGVGRDDDDDLMTMACIHLSSFLLR